jgi:hypothetical protein
MQTRRSGHPAFGWRVGAALLAATLLTVLAAPLAAQQTWDVNAVQPQLGVFHDPAAAREGENRWGWSAGVRFGISVAPRVHVIGAVSFLRTSNFERVTGLQGSAVYASETILTTIGVGFDLIARQETRVYISSTAGPAWGRRVETERSGSLSASRASSEAFSLNGAAVTSLGIEQTIARNLALDLSPQVYIGGGGVAPSVRLGLSVQLP